MSEIGKKSPAEKKAIPSILIKGNAKNNNVSVNGSKRDNATISQKKTKVLNKNKNKKKNDVDLSFHYSFKKGKFLCEPKILNNFLSFFNIRELFIIMEIDVHIHQAITSSDTFRKYLAIRKDFILKDNITNNKNKVKKKRQQNAKNNVNILNNNKNKEKSTSRKYYEKYDKSKIVDPVSLGLNGVLVVYPTKAGEKERLEKEMMDEKSEVADYMEDSPQKQKL